MARSLRFRERCPCRCSWASPSDTAQPRRSRIEGTINVLNQLAGPPIAGLLVGLGTAMAFTTGAGLYLVASLAAVVLLRIQQTPVAALRTPATPADRTISGGLRFIWRSPVLRNLTGLTAAMNLVWGCFSGLFVIHALASDGLGLSTKSYGLVLAADWA